MKRLISLILALLASLGALLCIPGCSKTTEEETVPAGETGETIMVQIEMDNGGIIKLELYPDIAPITVANFEKLVKEGFYDGLIFHRVIKNFMIQGGDPTGTGMGGAKEKIKGEFLQNGVNNPLKHTRGTLSMARAFDPNSASSQFFIMHADAPHLDGAYAAFGRVINGMDTVDEIADVPTDYSDRPKLAMRMKRVYIAE
jgi:peptidyl-prolyl cis-trans isomerase B (cyclophilin B)